MKTLILGLLLLALAVFVALMVKQDNGYVLISYKQWSIEGSLAFFLLLNTLLLGAIYLTVRFFVRIWLLPRQLNRWQDVRSQQRARRELSQGLLELSEGHWKSAEKNLVRHVDNSETPLLNYLAAARSAQQQGALERRDHYLQLAHESMPGADVAVGLTQAELQLGNDQQEQALATLKHLRKIAPRHPHVLKLLMDLYERMGEWEALERLLPELGKRRVVDQDALVKLGVKVYLHQLKGAMESSDSNALDSTWKKIPMGLRRVEDLIIGYSVFLKERGEDDRLEKLLRNTIQRQWGDSVVELYGRVEATDAAQQLSTAEGWLEQHPHNPVLLLALGRLSIRNRLWGKARSYLEASIGSQPTINALRELGALLEKMGEHSLAVQHFKSALELVSDAPLPDLPDNLIQAQLDESHKRAATPTDINPPQLEILADRKRARPKYSR